MIVRTFKEKSDTPRPSEHPPVMGEKMSKRLLYLQLTGKTTVLCGAQPSPVIIYAVANTVRGYKEVQYEGLRYADPPDVWLQIIRCQFVFFGCYVVCVVFASFLSSCFFH